MSDTPKTDALAKMSWEREVTFTDVAEHARRLERERDEEREKAERYRLQANAMMAQRDEARRKCAELQAGLDDIEEYGTEEINAAVDLRQQLAAALTERDKWKAEYAHLDKATDPSSTPMTMKEAMAQMKKLRDTGWGGAVVRFSDYMELKNELESYRAKCSEQERILGLSSDQIADLVAEKSLAKQEVDEIMRKAVSIIAGNCEEHKGAVLDDLKEGCPFCTQERLDDWENAAKQVDADHPDEVHCGCVPILKKQLRDLKLDHKRMCEDQIRKEDLIFKYMDEAEKYQDLLKVSEQSLASSDFRNKQTRSEWNQMKAMLGRLVNAMDARMSPDGSNFKTIKELYAAHFDASELYNKIY